MLGRKRLHARRRVAPNPNSKVGVGLRRRHGRNSEAVNED
jgi:hypothetical protein